MAYEVRIRRSALNYLNKLDLPSIGVSRLPSKGLRKSHLRETFAQ